MQKVSCKATKPALIFMGFLTKTHHNSTLQSFNSIMLNKTYAVGAWQLFCLISTEHTKEINEICAGKNGH